MPLDSRPPPRRLVIVALWIGIVAGILGGIAAVFAIAQNIEQQPFFVPGPGTTCSADDRFNDGMVLRRAGEWQAAAVAFTSVLECAKRIDALAQRGFSYRILGDFERAIRDFEAASEDAGGNFKERHYTGFAHLNLAEMGQGSDHLEAAISAFDHAIAISPNADSFILRGIVRRHLSVASIGVGRFYESAIVEGDLHLLSADPNQLRLAIADFDRAISLQEDYSDAYANRAIAFILARNHDAALLDIDRAIGLAGDNANPYWHELRIFAKAQ